jgi:hypothetical protein
MFVFTEKVTESFKPLQSFELEVRQPTFASHNDRIKEAPVNIDSFTAISSPVGPTNGLVWLYVALNPASRGNTCPFVNLRLFAVSTHELVATSDRFPSNKAEVAKRMYGIKEVIILFKFVSTNYKYSIF